MRDLVAVIALAFACVYSYAEFRGVKLIDVPGIVSVDPAPGVVVPGDGIRVLFVRPGDPTDRLVSGRENLPTLGVVRDWIQANGSFRYWAENVDLSKAPEDYRVLMGVPREASRWLVVANGHKVRYSGPWPATGDEAVKILEGCK